MLALFVAFSVAASSLPTQAVQSAIKEAVGKKLADPLSAQYDWQPAQEGVVYCGWVNAKNQFGAYSGYQPFMVLYVVNEQSGKAMVSKVDLEDYIVTPMCLRKGYRLTR